MKKAIIIFGLCTIVLSSNPTYANLGLTQLDDIVPYGLKVCDSLNNFSSSVEFPGMFIDSAYSLKFMAGYSNKPDNKGDYLGYPLTKYDNQNQKITDLKPCISIERSFDKFSSGIYLGNFSTNSSNHYALSIEDTVNAFKKSGVALNGAIWVSPTNMRYFKGLSLLASGDYDHRNTHFANIRDWKKIHTQYNYKNKYGQGLLTGTFGFIENNYWIIRLGYGKKIVAREEKRLDTLFFSSRNFLASTECFDNSFDMSYSNFEIGNIQQNKNFNFGIFAGGDRTNIEYGYNSIDTSVFHINVFITKGIKFEPFVLYTGVDFKYSGILYNTSYSRVGYLKLAHEYTVSKMAHNVDLKIPFFGMLSIGKKGSVMAGVDITYSLHKSNYNISAACKNQLKNSMVDVALYPFNVIYKLNNKVSISLSPKFEKSILIGSLAISYGF